MAQSPFIVSADWLAKHLNDPGMQVVDASWYLPQQGRDAKAEYDAGHIPRAVFFDHDAVVEPDTGLPHSLPSPRVFEQYASSMGIARDDTIVVYDGPGFFSAPRAWWMFRIMGAKKVYVLDGGIDGWKAEGRFVTNKPTKCAASAFLPQFDAAKVMPFEDMLKAVEDGSVQIADARSYGRFTGEQPEPREGMRSGHMPGAKSVPFDVLSENGKFKSLDELAAAFKKAGINTDEPVVTSCGSGVTAAVLALALESIGNEIVRIYDGSWAQWGSRDDTPIVTGPA